MDEDMILPNDFEGETAQPQAEQEAQGQQGEVVEEIPSEQQPQEQTQQPIEVEQPKIKVKYNHEERELTLEEARILAQKGMDYDKKVERLKALESDPRLSFVEELARENNMEVNQYLEAVKQHKEQQRLNELIQQNIPEELAREIMENRKYREQFESQNKARAEEEKINNEFKEFLSVFPDVKTDSIPDSVWEAQQKGIPLKYAYMEHQFNQMQNQLKVYKQNEENAKRTPVGSVITHGTTEPVAEDEFLKGFYSV